MISTWLSKVAVYLVRTLRKWWLRLVGRGSCRDCAWENCHRLANWSVCYILARDTAGIGTVFYAAREASAGGAVGDTSRRVRLCEHHRQQLFIRYRWPILKGYNVFYYPAKEDNCVTHR